MTAPKENNMPTFTITSDKPFVVLDVAEYQEILDKLERLEFLTSKTLKRDIAVARKEFKEGKTIPFEKVLTDLHED